MGDKEPVSSVPDRNESTLTSAMITYNYMQHNEKLHKKARAFFKM